MAALIDTNVLVYRFDFRAPRKQRVAQDLLRQGIAENSLLLPHQAVIEFIAAVTSPTKQALPFYRLEKPCERPKVSSIS